MAGDHFGRRRLARGTAGPSTTAGIVLRDPSTLRHGVLCALDAARAAGLAELAELIEQASSPGATGPAGQVRALDKLLGVERTGTGLQIRDATIPHHASVMFGMNSHQAAALIAALRRAS